LLRGLRRGLGSNVTLKKTVLFWLGRGGGEEKRGKVEKTAGIEERAKGNA